jgi:hypothetical protein
MNKSWVAHYKNKYPGGRVDSGADNIRVYDAKGGLRVVLVKDGCGQWVDVSKEHGASDEHCLAPIPKDARAFKICPQKGHLIKSEEHDERIEIAFGLADDNEGRVPSCIELEKKDGVKFDEKQRIDQNFISKKKSEELLKKQEEQFKQLEERAARLEKLEADLAAREAKAQVS